MHTYVAPARSPTLSLAASSSPSDLFAAWAVIKNLIVPLHATSSARVKGLLCKTRSDVQRSHFRHDRSHDGAASTTSLRWASSVWKLDRSYHHSALLCRSIHHCCADVGRTMCDERALNTCHMHSTVDDRLLRDSQANRTSQDRL